MKRSTILAALALVLGSAFTAQAGDTKGGLGFHVGESPMSGFFSYLTFSPNTNRGMATVGGRQWVSEKVGLDAAVGYSSFKSYEGTRRERWTSMSFDLGLPIVVKKFPHVNLIARPGFQYGKLENKDETSLPTTTTKYTMTGFSGTLEAEWYVTENLSLSASHGLAWASMKDDGTPEIKFTSIGTTGSNFTQLGFNLYLW